LGTLAKNARIVGGEITNTNSYPFLASFTYSQSNQVFCIGGIITNKHILTAAHCLFNEPRTFRRIKIKTGINSTNSNGRVLHEIAKVVFHPKYDILKYRERIKPYDLAVVKVKVAIVLNEFQNMIELPNTNIYDAAGYIVGWSSRTQITDLSSEQSLRKVNVIIYSKENCANAYQIKLYIGQFCIRKEANEGPSVGDSGGPLVMNGKIVGVASIILPYRDNLPIVYTSIYQYLGFIYEALAA
ncbi:PREDICTED: chymotrypsin-1-like, partial [Ceratosolen solmsi marchali]|uniref:Chymotrypsin-1-like n=1 Tax=Ceratosolen solmsi marchali TaxID=326594 RepID=A0AAJ7E1W9_9HYME